jgi:hypothetical protein
MAMTNAERQARWRDRMRDKMATAKFALQAADDGDPLHQIVRLKQDLAKEKERSKELREKLKARDAMERIDKNLADHHSTRAMYAEADKERLQAEVDRLTEENERLRSVPLRDGGGNGLIDRMSDVYNAAHSRAVLAIVANADRAGTPDEDDPWFEWRERLLEHPHFRPLTEDECLAYVEKCGASQGEALALQLLHDSLAEAKPQRRIAA